MRECVPPPPPPPEEPPPQRRRIGCVEEELCGALRISGITVVRQAVAAALDATQSRTVVSVGSGEGVAEAHLELSDSVRVVCVDPSPESYNRAPGDGVAHIPPSFSTAHELVSADVWPAMATSGVVLLILWPLPEKTSGYDIEAITLLQPAAVVVVCYVSGGSGSAHLLEWVRRLRDTSGDRVQLPEPMQSSTACAGPAAEAAGCGDYTLIYQHHAPAYWRSVPQAQLKDTELIRVSVEKDSELGVVWGTGASVTHIDPASPLHTHVSTGLVVTHVDDVRTCDGAAVEGMLRAGGEHTLRLSPYPRRWQGTQCACIAAAKLKNKTSATTQYSAAKPVWLEDAFAA